MGRMVVASLSDLREESIPLSSSLWLRVPSQCVSCSRLLVRISLSLFFLSCVFIHCLFFEGSVFTGTLGPFTEGMASVFLELASVTEECCYLFSRIWRRVQRNLSTSFQLKTRGSGVSLPGFLQSDPHVDAALLLEAL